MIMELLPRLQQKIISNMIAMNLFSNLINPFFTSGVLTDILLFCPHFTPFTLLPRCCWDYHVLNNLRETLRPALEKIGKGFASYRTISQLLDGCRSSHRITFCNCICLGHSKRINYWRSPFARLLDFLIWLMAKLQELLERPRKKDLIWIRC